MVWSCTNADCRPHTLLLPPAELLTWAPPWVLKSLLKFDNSSGWSLPATSSSCTNWISAPGQAVLGVLEESWEFVWRAWPVEGWWWRLKEQCTGESSLETSHLWARRKFQNTSYYHPDHDIICQDMKPSCSMIDYNVIAMKNIHLFSDMDTK